MPNITTLTDETVGDSQGRQLANGSRTRTHRRDILRAFVAMLAIAPAAFVSAGEVAEPVTGRGNLLVIGGGLRPNNAEVYRKFIELAGVGGGGHVGVVPTASATLATSQAICKILEGYGVPADQVSIIDITPTNADVQANNPEIVARIRACNGLFFAGGDQLRITRAFLGADGKATPAWHAAREVYDRGGVIAGTSAGAAMQSELMISSVGIPVDTLDYGLSPVPFRRNVYVSQGMGFFKAGLIDQHFNTYRGRLARLSRVLIERKIPLGFGVDENTAMFVRNDGIIEVLGASNLTVVDSRLATRGDGPLGVHIAGVTLSVLSHGDTFDLKTGEFAFDPSKAPIAKGQEAGQGNHLVFDLAGDDAINVAVTEGLVDNTAESQVGLMLRRNDSSGYAYKFTFSKTADTVGYRGIVGGTALRAAKAVRLDIDPVALAVIPVGKVDLDAIATALATPAATGPMDLGAATKEVQALAFRGILPRDGVRPSGLSDPLTRAEFASVLAHAARVDAAQAKAADIADVAESTPFAGDIAKVVALGYMALDRDGTFRPSAPISRQDAATALVRAYQAGDDRRDAVEPIAFADAESIAGDSQDFVYAATKAGLLAAKDNRFRPVDPATREEVVTAVYKMLGFPW